MYLAVSKEGQEIIFEGKPIRRGRDKENDHIIYTQDLITHSIIGYNCVTDLYHTKPVYGNFSNLTEWFNRGYFYNVLPEGTIRNIIGCDLTWEDEPVEIDFFNYKYLADLYLSGTNKRY